MHPSISILLFGPRGCGKTLFASANFSQMRQQDPVWMTVKLISAEILEDPLNKLREAFNKIEQLGINGVFIEDIDVLFNALRPNVAGHMFLVDKIKNHGEKRLLIATTRRPDSLLPDELEAFLDILPVLYPNENDRLDILRIHASKAGLQTDLAAIVRETALWSGEELEKLIKHVRNAGRQPTMTYVLGEIETIGQGANKTARARRMREFLDFTTEHCTHNQIRADVIRDYSELVGGHDSIGTSSQTHIDDPVLREEIQRARRNMNVENVDLALFQLAKLFENELKSFLSVAEQKKAIKLTKSGTHTLASMIDAVVQSGIVKKRHHLDLLREQRNERAHDNAPDTAERERLLEHAPFLRDLYIEYISFFRKERHRLEKGE